MNYYKSGIIVNADLERLYTLVVIEIVSLFDVL